MEALHTTILKHAVIALPSILCAFVGVLSATFVVTADISRTTAGTFGMFSTVDEVRTRLLQVQEVTSDGTSFLPLQRVEIDLDRVRLRPTEQNLQNFLRYLACNTPVVSPDATQLKLSLYAVAFDNNRMTPQRIARASFDPRSCL